MSVNIIIFLLYAEITIFMCFFIWDILPDLLSRGHVLCLCI